MAFGAALSSPTERAIMQYDEWPELIVRSWQTVLAKRDPEWGSQEEDHDGIDEAYETRRLHELRGIIIGQVAEIESLLYYITSQIHERHTGLPGRPKRSGAGGFLNHLEDLLQIVNANSKAIEEKILKIKKVIKRRNKIVHATIHVGYSFVAFTGSRDAVIIYLSENDRKKVTQQHPDNESLPTDDTEEDDLDGDLDESILKAQLAETYEALDACLDIWEMVDSQLPSTIP